MVCVSYFERGDTSRTGEIWRVACWYATHVTKANLKELTQRTEFLPEDIS